MSQEWVYLTHPETNGGGWFPNDPLVIEVHEGKGWVVSEDQPDRDAVDQPEPPEQPAEPEKKKTSKAAASATTKEE